MALSVDMRRARAQKALDDSGYADETEEQRKKRKQKSKPAVDEIEWVPAQESVQTTGSN